MTLSILFGDGTKDHELALLKQMQHVLKQQPQAQIFYIVPNKIKFQTEINILTRLAALDDRQGATIATQNVQVFSLSRLAWFYMNDTKLYRHATVSPEALAMLVQQLLQAHQNDLQLYANLRNKQGFISQFTSQLLEIKEAGLQWSALQKMADALTDDVVLQNKLSDLALIGQALDTELGERDQYLSSDLLGVLKAFLLRGERDLSQQYFFINGYSQMNQQEKGVVEALMVQAADVTLALPIDHLTGTISHQVGNENDLFAAPKKLALQLQQFAIQNQIAVKMMPVETARTLSLTQQNVARFWSTYEQKGIQQFDGPELAIWETTSRYQEIEQLAQKIRMMVVNGQARYRDFVLLTPDLKQYENVIPAIFAKYELPLFMDVDHLMRHHPLVTFIDQLLTLAPQYTLQNIMTVLKTELFIPESVAIDDYREALAITENYALAKNMMGGFWTNSDAWQYDYRVTEDSDATLRQRAAKYDAQLALIHDQISKQIAPFLTQLSAAKDARQMAQLLYQFLMTHGVQQQLINWRDQAIAQGNLFAAQQSEQVWDKLIDVLDDFVMVFDTEQLTADNLREMLNAAFSNAKYSGVPAAMDQVLVSESGIVQIQGVPHVIIFGATSNNLPVTTRQRALLQDRDRIKLQALLPEGTQLRDTAEVTMAQDSLRIYNAMLIGTQSLLWSYPTGDGTVKLKASTYVERLQQSFQVPIKRFEVQPTGREDETILAQKIGTVASTLSHLLLAKREVQRNNQQLSASWQQVENVLRRVAKADLEAAITALHYSNQTETVASELITQLFSNTLKTSISRLETYAKNPYEFFLMYGLRLQPRQELQLTPAEQGTLMHAILEQVFQSLQGQPLGVLSVDGLQQLEQQAVAAIFASDDPTFDIFQSSQRMLALTDNLVARVHQALINMQNGQPAAGQIKTLGTETAFGAEGLAPIEFEIDGHPVVVRGKVDRYDEISVPESAQSYLSIVDYKAGKREFDFAQAYNGLELQLMTYWQAMQANYPEMAVGSASFWSLKDEPTKPVVTSAAESFSQQQALAKEAHDNAGMYRGLILDDEQFVATLESQSAYSPFAIARNKNGSYSQSGSDVVSSDELTILKQFNHLKITALTQRILAGQFPLMPYRDGTKTGLTYTDYKDVMRFDAKLDNRYHDLVKGKKKDILAKMQHDIETQGASDDGIH
ncbi:PD-(D/E)XK nuclease family protein [Weissella diestrammenae]|uniref:PD-(D/E)XK nuclease family protein n=1 Tax=Weissella diestrammenae TaxID=1162633 RepID=A0A7G9T6P9_9LACO|nr:PD-(D/E)XK nuclease family protein [Weissella diestrammenae]MCM0582940.1 PD-(D/E)XK nuclease family protein [Weissella diestrammenae]QNN75774.1 PD-(D/E)XK nuclease family protein [Weissella diestrammenae]